MSFVQKFVVFEIDGCVKIYLFVINVSKIRFVSRRRKHMRTIANPSKIDEFFVCRQNRIQKYIYIEYITTTWSTKTPKYFLFYCTKIYTKKQL